MTSLTIGRPPPIVYFGTWQEEPCLSFQPPTDNPCWIPYKYRKELLAEELPLYQKIEVQEAKAEKPKWVWIDISSAAKRFAKDFFALLPELTGKLQPSEVEATAIKVAKLFVYDTKERPTWFSAEKEGLPFDTCISEHGDIFLDLKEEPFKDKEKFRKSFCLNRHEWVAMGVSPVIDKLAAVHEIRTLNLFRNTPGIIHTFSAGICGSQLIVFQELYKEDDLCDYFIKEHPFSYDQKIDITRQLLKILETVLKVGTPCDISPENILMKKDVNGNFKVALTDLQHFVFNGVFHNGWKFYWKSTYMSPELYRAYHSRDPRKGITPKAVVWAMGIILYNLFMGGPPFDLESPGYLRVFLSLEPGWVYTLYKGQIEPSPIFPLLDAMLHPDPEKRSSPEEALELFHGLVKNRLLERNLVP